MYAMMESKRRDEGIERQTVTGIVDQHGDWMLKIAYRVQEVGYLAQNVLKKEVYESKGHWSRQDTKKRSYDPFIQVWEVSRGLRGAQGKRNGACKTYAMLEWCTEEREKRR